MQSNIFLLYFGALILFVLYRRVRRNIGWQPFRSRRMERRSVLCAIIGLVFLYGSLEQPISLVSDLIGILVGAVLACYGAQLTKFKNDGGSVQYRTNVWIGSLVSLLFLFRFGFRILFLFQSGLMRGSLESHGQSPAALSTISGNSWTAGLMLILFSYYVVYYALLFRKHRQIAKVKTNMGE